jgi:hypothetical protein
MCGGCSPRHSAEGRGELSKQLAHFVADEGDPFARIAEERHEQPPGETFKLYLHGSSFLPYTLRTLSVR